FEHLSGEPGHAGARSKMVYVNGKHRIELFETITLRNLPDQFDGVYDWGDGSNTLENRFIELAENRTRWESTCTYEFKTLFLKLMGWFLPGSFKKQNQKFLDNFKAFCEHGTSVQDSDTK
ncbi:MAG: SRPBCC family protein, partial [Planctomycetota bacterium]